ncbi:MAG TPA: DHA2 family efflux MFS transporter permease subunit [Candidatus Binataceae bacterium]|nr:DHA2 family efflux MFS transporter permease subunit [Candidatus Binataceae bacterium]
MEADAAITVAAPQPPYDVHSHKWLIALAVMLGTTLEVLDTSIVNVALPHMQGSFSASVDEIAWVLTSYLVANGVMIPMTGWISSRFGRKRYFLTSVFVFVAASALCGAARSLDQMVLFRLIQGAAGAAMIPSSQAILMETFPPEEQQMGMAVWGVGLMVAPILGPTLGGWITDNWNWRWNFYINIPIGIVAFLMVSAFVHDPSYLRERRQRGGHVDYAGIMLLASALGLMQIVLDRGQRADWFNSPWVVYATLASATATVLLIWRELAFSDPIIDIRIFANRVFSVAVTLTIWFSAVLFGTLLLNPVFLQELMGYNASKAGLIQAPRGIGSMFSMMVVGQLGRFRINTRPLIGLGFTLLAISLWVMSGWNLQVAAWNVIWPNALMGLGLGLIFPIVSALSFSTVKPERIGYASSLYNMMRNSGAAIGIAYMTTSLVAYQQIYQSRLTQHFSVFEAWRLTQAAPTMPGSPAFILGPGHGQSLGMVYGMIQRQASMLAFNDIYRTLAAATLVAIPLFLLMGGATPAVGGPAH